MQASLSVVVEPVASEFLRGTETDNPGTEHGPGWVALLARDYAWRTTADVVNRGYSGMSSSMLRADLPELLAPFRREDVVAVTLMIGLNDAVAEGEPTHVRRMEFAPTGPRALRGCANSAEWRLNPSPAGAARAIQREHGLDSGDVAQGDAQGEGR